jgi:26S proteasome non-ATPase regulatory subunit 9
MSTDLKSKLTALELQIKDQRALTLELDAKCKTIQQKISELVEQEEVILGPNYKPGCKLVDNEGYPLPVDVYTIRELRSQSIRAVNDYKETNARLETEMLAYFGLISSRDDIIELLGDDGVENEENEENEKNEENEENEKNETKDTLNNAAIPANLTPFLRIDLVLDDTPAQDAGLSNGDQILLFGTIDEEEFRQTGLSGLVQFVTNNKNVQFPVIFLSHSNFAVQKTNLTPREWSGQGLLGCKVIPM